MVSKNQLESLKKAIDRYIRSFYSKNPVYQKHIEGKKEHLYHTATTIKDIGESLNLKNDELNLAEVIAFLHDIGRFEQFNTYRTFVDSLSEDHAAIGLKVIEEEGFLDEFSKESQRVIRLAIANHNKSEISAGLDGKDLLFVQIIRDADKVDLFRIVTEKFCNELEDDSEKAYPDIPEVSGKVYEDFMAGRSIDITQVSTMNDFKFLQLAWIFNLKFQQSFIILQKRNYIDCLKSTFQHNESTLKMFERLNSYIESKLSV